MISNIIMLLLGEDRVSTLEPVLVEQVLAHLRGDVQQRVAHAEESRHLLKGEGELGGRPQNGCLTKLRVTTS